MWIKKLIKAVLRQERILVLSLMKGFDPLQMLTSVFLNVNVNLIQNTAKYFGLNKCRLGEQKRIL